MKKLSVLLALLISAGAVQAQPGGNPAARVTIPKCQSPLPLRCPVVGGYVCWSNSDILNRCESNIWTSHVSSGHNDGANCDPGEYPLGVDASGAVQDCTDVTIEIDAAVTAAAFTPDADPSVNHPNYIAGHNIAYEGSSLPTQPVLNFTGSAVVCTDGAGETVCDMTVAAAGIEYYNLRYTFDETVNASPSAGALAFNSLDPSFATALYINDDAAASMDASQWLSNIHDGDVIVLSASNSGSKTSMLRVIGPPTDTVGEWRIDFQLMSESDTDFEDGDTIGISLMSSVGSINVPLDLDRDGNPDYINVGDFDGDGKLEMLDDVGAAMALLTDTGPKYMFIGPGKFCSTADVADVECSDSTAATDLNDNPAFLDGVLQVPDDFTIECSGPHQTILQGPMISEVEACTGPSEPWACCSGVQAGTCVRQAANTNYRGAVITNANVGGGRVNVRNCGLDGGTPTMSWDDEDGNVPTTQHRMGVFFDGCNDCSFEGGRVQNTFHSGLYSKNGSNVTFHDNTLSNIGNYQGDSAGQTGPRFPCLYLFADEQQSTSNASITSNIANGCGDSFVTLRRAAPGGSPDCASVECNVTDILVDGNSVVGTGLANVADDWGKCMTIRGASNVVISDHVCRDSGPFKFDPAAAFYDDPSASYADRENAVNNITISGVSMKGGMGGFILGEYNQNIHVSNMSVTETSDNCVTIGTATGNQLKGITFDNVSLSRCGQAGIVELTQNGQGVDYGIEGLTFRNLKLHHTDWENATDSGGFGFWGGIVFKNPIRGFTLDGFDISGVSNVGIHFQGGASDSLIANGRLDMTVGEFQGEILASALPLTTPCDARNEGQWWWVSNGDNCSNSTTGVGVACVCSASTLTVWNQQDGGVYNNDLSFGIHFQNDEANSTGNVLANIQIGNTREDSLIWLRNKAGRVTKDNVLLGIRGYHTLNAITPATRMLDIDAGSNYNVVTSSRCDTSLQGCITNDATGTSIIGVTDEGGADITNLAAAAQAWNDSNPVLLTLPGRDVIVGPVGGPDINPKFSVVSDDDNQQSLAVTVESYGTCVANVCTTGSRSIAGGESLDLPCAGDNDCPLGTTDIMVICADWDEIGGVDCDKRIMRVSSEGRVSINHDYSVSGETEDIFYVRGYSLNPFPLTVEPDGVGFSTNQAEGAVHIGTPRAGFPQIKFDQYAACSDVTCGAGESWMCADSDNGLLYACVNQVLTNVTATGSGAWTGNDPVSLVDTNAAVQIGPVPTTTSGKLSVVNDTTNEINLVLEGTAGQFVPVFKVYDNGGQVAMQINAAGRVIMDGDGADAVVIGDDSTTPAHKLHLIGSLGLASKGAQDASVAGVGQLWAKTGSPNTLWFTDDQGGNYQLGIGGSGLWTSANNDTYLTSGDDVCFDGAPCVYKVSSAGVATLSGVDIPRTTSGGCLTLKEASGNGDEDWKLCVPDVLSTPAKLFTMNTDGILPPELLGANTPSASVFLRGDGVWETPPQQTIPQANTTTSGVVEIAEIAEINAGVDNDRAITPAGLAGSQLATDVTANNAKVTNATHTGDVTGSVGLTISPDSVEASMVDFNYASSTAEGGAADTVASSVCGGHLTGSGGNCDLDAEVITRVAAAIYIDDVTAAHEITFMLPPWAGVMTRIDCEKFDGTGSVGIKMCVGEDRGDDTCTNNVLGAAGDILTCGLTPSSDTSLNVTYDDFVARDKLTLQITSVTDNGDLNLVITATVND